MAMGTRKSRFDLNIEFTKYLSFRMGLSETIAQCNTSAGLCQIVTSIVLSTSKLEITEGTLKCLL